MAQEHVHALSLLLGMAAATLLVVLATRLIRLCAEPSRAESTPRPQSEEHLIEFLENAHRKSSRQRIKPTQSEDHLREMLEQSHQKLKGKRRRSHDTSVTSSLPVPSSAARLHCATNALEDSANKVAYEEHGPFRSLPSSSFHVNPAAARDRRLSDFCDKLCLNFNELIGARSKHPDNELRSSCHIDRDTSATKSECSACVDVREELSPLDISLISSLASPETCNPKERLPPIEEMLSSPTSSFRGHPIAARRLPRHCIDASRSLSPLCTLSRNDVLSTPEATEHSGGVELHQTQGNIGEGQMLRQARGLRCYMTRTVNFREQACAGAACSSGGSTLKAAPPLAVFGEQGGRAFFGAFFGGYAIDPELQPLTRAIELHKMTRAIELRKMQSREKGFPRSLTF
jgi:hypothetical protein